MCSNIGTPNYRHFPFGTNGKIEVLGVPILKHFRVHVGFDCLTSVLVHPHQLDESIPSFMGF